MPTAASTPTDLPALAAAPKSDLKVGTLECIARMKTKSPRHGINVETHHLSIDRAKLETYLNKLDTYRKQKAEFEQKISQQFEIGGWEAVIAAGREFREALAATFSNGRPPKEGK